MPIIDPYQNQSASRPNSYRNALEITPSDTEDLPVLPTFVWVEKSDGGPISLRMQMGDEAITINIPALGNDDHAPNFFGWTLCPTRIFATGTTADRVILFW